MPAPMSLRSLLGQRVERIMDTSRSLSTRVGSLFLFVVVVSGLMVTTVAGFVGQTAISTFRLGEVAVAWAVTAPPTPTLAVATAKLPMVGEGSRCRMPSLLAVAASAIRSVTGVANAPIVAEFTPEIRPAGSVFVQSNSNATSDGANGEVGVSAITNVCAWPAAMSTGVSAVPTSSLVAGLVVW